MCGIVYRHLRFRRQQEHSREEPQCVSTGVCPVPQVEKREGNRCGGGRQREQKCKAWQAVPCVREEKNTAVWGKRVRKGQ